VALGRGWALTADGAPIGYRFAQNAAIAADGTVAGPLVLGVQRTVGGLGAPVGLFARVRPPLERGDQRAVRYGAQVGAVLRWTPGDGATLAVALAVEALVAQPGRRRWVQAGGSVAWELVLGAGEGWSAAVGAELRWLPTVAEGLLGATWLSGRWTARRGWYAQLSALRPVDRGAPEDLRAELTFGYGWR
jgi:hypothetical protein